MVPRSDCAKLEDNFAELVAQGYTAITADMTAEEIKAILDTDNAKVVLTEDVELNNSLDVRGKNITINGGGHMLTFKGLYSYGKGVTVENIKINNTIAAGNAGYSMARSIYNASGDTTIRNVSIMHNGAQYQASGIELHGDNNIVENINITMNGGDKATQLVGIYIWGSGKINNVNADIEAVNADTLMAAVGSHTDKVIVEGMSMSAQGGRAYGVIGLVSGINTQPAGGTAQRPSALYDGESNTQKIIDELKEEALAAQAAKKFTPDKLLKDDADFGQGTWYLPAIGELMDMHGTDTAQMTAGWGDTSGAVGDNKKAINDALGELEKHGIATKLTDNYYWSSSEYVRASSWDFYFGSGYRYGNDKGNSYHVRVFQLVENCFRADSSNKPQIGDVMYADKTWGSAADYDKDAGKIAVGIVANVDNRNGSVKLVNLKDLAFSSTGDINNFDPDNPYDNTEAATRWSIGDKMYQDIEGVDNYADFNMLLALNPNAPVVSVEALNAAFAVPAAESYQAQYNEILSQYDALINDALIKALTCLKAVS